MNDGELIRRVNEAMYRQCRQRGYAAPVDVLIDIGALDKKKAEDWRFGRVSCLERVCTMNLSKLSTVLHQMRVYAQKNGLKPSWCCYRQWGGKKKAGAGKKPVTVLRFSVSGAKEVERWYATHFVDPVRTAELKAESRKKTETEPGTESAVEQDSNKTEQS